MPQDALVAGIGAVAAVIAALVVAVGTVLAAALAVWRKIKPVLGEIRSASAISAHELQHNSGSSMKDALRRIEARQQEQGEQIRDHGRDIRQLREETAEALDDVRTRIIADQARAHEAHTHLAGRITTIESSANPQEQS